MGLWHTHGSPNLGQKTRPYGNQQKKKEKKTCKIVDFAGPADHRIKLKRSKKKDKYLDLDWKLNKQWNMKVTIIPIVIGVFGTVIKGLLKELEDLEVGGRVVTIQTKSLFERLDYGEESWILEETCCHSNSSERPSTNVDGKNSTVGNSNRRTNYKWWTWNNS